MLVHDASEWAAVVVVEGKGGRRHAGANATGPSAIPSAALAREVSRLLAGAEGLEIAPVTERSGLLREVIGVRCSHDVLPGSFGLLLEDDDRAKGNGAIEGHPETGVVQAECRRGNA